MAKVKLSGAQVTLLRKALDEYLGNVASRGCHPHLEMEEFIGKVQEIVPWTKGESKR